MRAKARVPGARAGERLVVVLEGLADYVSVRVEADVTVTPGCYYDFVLGDCRRDGSSRCPARSGVHDAVKQFAPTYDAAVLSVLDQAYSAACRELDIDPHPSDPALNKDVREALAKAIVDMAATGLRDPRILRARALQAIGNRNASKR